MANDLKWLPVTPAYSVKGPMSPALRKPLPAELSAERRTPRKLDIRKQPNSPTPKGPLRKDSAMDGLAHGSSKINGVRDQLASERHKPATAGDGSKQASTSSVLGKRRTGYSATNGNNLSEPSSVASGPRKLSNVNGMVKHLNGVNDTEPDGAQSQAGGGASEGQPVRKAAPKLRKASGPTAVNGAA